MIIHYFAASSEHPGTADTLAWTLKVCKIMAFMAVIMGLGPLFYILLGFR